MCYGSIIWSWLVKANYIQSYLNTCVYFFFEWNYPYTILSLHGNNIVFRILLTVAYHMHKLVISTSREVSFFKRLHALATSLLLCRVLQYFIAVITMTFVVEMALIRVTCNIIFIAAECDTRTVYIHERTNDNTESRLFLI